MKEQNRVSDGDLAAYLDGMLSEQDRTKVGALFGLDDIEVAGVSRKAVKTFGSSETVSLPSWSELKPVDPFKPVVTPLAMAGFLGEQNEDGEAGGEEDA